MKEQEIQRMLDDIEGLEDSLSRCEKDRYSLVTRFDRRMDEYSDLYRKTKIRENDLKTTLIGLVEEGDLEAEYAAEIANIFNLTLDTTTAN